MADPTRVLEKAMEKTKQDRANFRVQHIPIEEMFTAQELMDLKTAFEAVSMGEAFVNTESLKALFADMQIYPTDEQLSELLETCGKSDEEDFISMTLKRPEHYQHRRTRYPLTRAEGPGGAHKLQS